MPLWLEQPAVAFIGEEAGSLGQVELEQAGRGICWKLVISVRNPVLLIVRFSRPPQLLPWWFTVALFSGCRPCVKPCKETAWRWTFWTANGDMGRRSPLITCVDSPGAERQKPPVQTYSWNSAWKVKHLWGCSSVSSCCSLWTAMPACIDWFTTCSPQSQDLSAGVSLGL